MSKSKRARGEGRLYKRGDSNFWWIQFYDGSGKQRRESTRTEDEKKAARLLRKRLGEVAAKVFAPSSGLRYEQVRDALYTYYQTQRCRSLYIRKGKPHLNSVGRLDDFFANYKVAKIDTDLMREFIRDQQERGKADSTINRSLSILRRMFMLARQDKKISAVPFFPMLTEPAARSGFFEDADYKQLCAALPEYLKLPLAIGYFTGMRKAEVLGLDWTQIDLLRNTIRLRAGETKSGKGRTIPIVPQLRVLLEAQHARRQPECPYVCVKIDGKGRARKIGNFLKAWCNAAVKAGLGSWEEAKHRSAGRIYHGKLFHDLRRSAVRNLVRAGVPQSTAMSISGHQTADIFRRYDIGSEQDIAEAATKLARYHEAQKDGAVSGPLAEKPQTDRKSIN